MFDEGFHLLYEMNLLLKVSHVARPPFSALQRSQADKNLRQSKSAASSPISEAPVLARLSVLLD